MWHNLRVVTFYIYTCITCSEVKGKQCKMSEHCKYDGPLFETIKSGYLQIGNIVSNVFVKAMLRLHNKLSYTDGVNVVNNLR